MPNCDQCVELQDKINALADAIGRQQRLAAEDRGQLLATIRRLQTERDDLQIRVTGLEERVTGPGPVLGMRPLTDEELQKLNPEKVAQHGEKFFASLYLGGREVAMVAFTVYERERSEGASEEDRYRDWSAALSATALFLEKGVNKGNPMPDAMVIARGDAGLPTAFGLARRRRRGGR